MTPFANRPILSADGRDALDRFAASHALAGRHTHPCGHTNNSLICPCSATLPPRDSGGSR
jgi:hypothetical protein